MAVQAEPAAQRLVVGEQPRDLLVERVGFGEVAQADGAAAHLVLVGRADAALRGADLHAGGHRRLAMGVEFAVQRQDQRDVLGDEQQSGVTATPCAAILAISSRRWCGSSTTPLPMTESLPGRTMPEGSSASLKTVAVDDQRVAGIVAALEAHHDVGLVRQPVDDLALALVAPLGADHHHVRHRSRLIQTKKPRRRAPEPFAREA